MNTIEFLDRLRARRGLTSDYQVAKALGVSHTRVSNWRTGRNTFDDGVALLIAAELAMLPGYVLACMKAERAKRPHVREAWLDVAKQLEALA
jgi:transcriptional regulator with XRE-family HTH domain